MLCLWLGTRLCLANRMIHVPHLILRFSWGLTVLGICRTEAVSRCAIPYGFHV